MLVCKYTQPEKTVTHHKGQTQTLVREGVRRLTDSSFQYIGYHPVINIGRRWNTGLIGWRSVVQWLGPGPFHQRLSVVFIFTLPLTERQTVMILKSGALSYLRGHRIVQHWHSHAVWCDNPNVAYHTPRHGLPKALSLGVKRPEPKAECLFRSHSEVINELSSVSHHHTCSSLGA